MQAPVKIMDNVKEIIFGDDITADNFLYMQRNNMAADTANGCCGISGSGTLFEFCGS